MNKQLQERFIAAATFCVEQLSECPELKNYRIYRQPEASPRQPVKESAAIPARRRAEKWILLVSAKRLGKTRRLTVEVRGCR